MTTVAASIILAAITGGIIFVLLDSWQRRAASPSPRPEPEPAAVWRPEPQPARPTWDLDDRKREEPEGSLWSGWASRR